MRRSSSAVPSCLTEGEGGYHEVGVGVGAGLREVEPIIIEPVHVVDLEGGEVGKLLVRVLRQPTLQRGLERIEAWPKV
jgi:hypothetical protein